MNQSEFNFWAQRSKQGYAEDKARANNLTQHEAAEIANKDFHRLLPNGLATQDNFLYTMKNENEITVGYMWFGVRGPEDNRKAFLLDIIIEKDFRGQGFGKKAMQLLEKEVMLLGLKEIGLHVFGFNERAIELYKSLGYKTTDLVMAKNL